MEAVNINTQLPARLDEAADNILRETSRANPLLRFKKRQFLIGDDEVAPGREYRAFPLEWTRGWVKWHDGAIVEQRLGRVADGYRPPERDQLGDCNESEWPDGKDPWIFQNLLPLEDCETGEIAVFVSSSFGGKIAVERLCNRVARDLKSGRDLGRPTIKLAFSSFRTKQYGEIDRPEFEIVSWENERQHDQVLPPMKNVLSDEISF
jgi:hypothetical protein